MAEPNEPVNDKDQKKAPAGNVTAPELPEDSKIVPETAEPEPETDPETDNAVDDITRTEGDDELKAQDAAAGVPAVATPQSGGRFKRFWHNWWADPRKKWGTITGIVVVIGALFAVPVTRYNILGLALRTNVTVQVVDNKTGAPVTSATVELSGKTAETGAGGKASLRVNMGTGSLKVTKKYYGGYSHNELVSGGNTFKVTLPALGRQVQVKVVNKISGKPVQNAKITAAGANAKTDKNGLATVVLPSGATTQSATLTFSGYNDAAVTIDANGNLAKDTFSVTPSGKLYFLSNLSGSIDVVKTNLDGTDRQTVLAGTGNEDPHSTSLLASRDWKYLALLSKRSGDNASVYLIDTTDGDKLTTVDDGNANFSLVGWSGDRFVYTVDRSATISNWQPDQQALKSFDPTTGHTLLLDQTQASGSSNAQYTAQFFGTPYLIGDQVVYTKGWQADSSYNYVAELSGKEPELDSIGADGSGHRVIKSFTVVNGNYLNLATELYEPDALYLRTWDQNNQQSTFYEYENGKVTDAADMTDDIFENTPYPTYLLSPSGNQTFWAAQRDGKNTLFTGDNSATDPKQIASLSDYNAYGWYTDNYVLVSKDSSELYIMPATGGTPLKITDYYKPAINYQGYGGGYGGL